MPRSRIEEMKAFAHTVSMLLAVAGVFMVLLAVPANGFAATATAQVKKPVGAPTKLRTDDLVTPLGLDDTAPRFAWQLADGRDGARQTAYQIQVATRRELLASGKPDVWDSGKIGSDQSLGV